MTRWLNFRSSTYALACSLLIVAVVFSVLHTSGAHASGETVSVWLTTPDQAHLLAPQSNLTFSSTIASNASTINVNEGTAYQKMTGFGASMTDSSAYLIYDKMSAAQRTTLMNNLFNASSGIGLDFLRQPIGASDLALNEYTYDDLPSGQTDTSMSKFSIAHDNSYIIPVLQQALQINPNITTMATPWSPPAWMKSNGSLNSGGTLNTSDYAAYAQYLVDFIKAYQAQGIPINYITPQNEPLNSNNMPTLNFPATSETTFIANNLGPALAANGLSTKILGWDHNWDVPSYPTTIMNNATANSYTPGIAWHCYGGDASAMGTFHNSYPTKDTFETECSDGTWIGANWPSGFQNTMELLINSTRNWSKSVVRWGMALDTNMGPFVNTPGACSTCTGIVTINQANGNVTYTSDYYALGQASKFVLPGASRIDSNSFGAGNLEDVAFKNTDGSKVLVAYNGGSSSKNMQVQWNNEAFSYTLAAGAAATFKWSGTGTVSTPPASTPTPTATPPATGPVTGVNYYITSKNSGSVIDDTGWSTTNGTVQQQWSKVSGQQDQQWTFVPADPGFYYIKNRYSGLVLDDTGWSTTNGTAIQQWSNVSGQQNQEWSLSSAGGGYYNIVNRYSGKVLDVTGQSTANGAVIEQWSLVSGQANQLWSLVQA
jgi:glucosylceramidase